MVRGNGGGQLTLHQRKIFKRVFLFFLFLFFFKENSSRKKIFPSERQPRVPFSCILNSVSRCFFVPCSFLLILLVGSRFSCFLFLAVSSSYSLVSLLFSLFPFLKISSLVLVALFFVVPSVLLFSFSLLFSLSFSLLCTVLLFSLLFSPFFGLVAFSYSFPF